MTLKRSPLHETHCRLGGQMIDFGGWELPVKYTGIVEEHLTVRRAAGLFDISHMARVSLGGPAALALLERIFTNSVATMKDGQVRYGLVCEDDGGILDDVLVYRWPDGFAAVINASNREKILTWIESQSDGLYAEVRDQTLDTTMIAVQGPKSVELVAGMFADDVSGLKYYYATPSRYKDKPCVVSRTGYTGEDGFEVIVPNALGVALWEEFIAKGVVPCGLGSRDTLRLEAAMPLYGHELNETIDPIHAGLSWAVKFDKGDFIGKAAIQKATADTTKPVRVGLEIEGKRAAREGCAITDADNAQVGTVTSGSLCPWLDKSLAMGYVNPQFASVGSALDIDVRGTKLPATVVPLPFYKRKK